MASIIVPVAATMHNKCRHFATKYDFLWNQVDSVYVARFLHFCILLLKTDCFYLRLAILVTGRLIVVTKWRKWRHSPAKMETALSMPLQFWRPPAFVSKTNQPAAQIFCVPNLQTWGGTLGIRHCRLGGPTLHKQGEKPPRQFKCLIHSKTFLANKMLPLLEVFRIGLLDWSLMRVQGSANANRREIRRPPG